DVSCAIKSHASYRMRSSTGAIEIQQIFFGPCSVRLRAKLEHRTAIARASVVRSPVKITRWVEYNCRRATCRLKCEERSLKDVLCPCAVGVGGELENLRCFWIGSRAVEIASGVKGKVAFGAVPGGGASGHGQKSFESELRFGAGSEEASDDYCDEQGA